MYTASLYPGRPPSSSCQNAKCEGGTASHLKNLNTNNNSVCLRCGSGVPGSRPSLPTISLHCLMMLFKSVGPQTEENDCLSLPETTVGQRCWQRSSVHKMKQEKHQSILTTSRNLHRQCLCTQFRLVGNSRHSRSEERVASEAPVGILYVLSMCAVVSLTLFNPSTPSMPHKRRSGVCASV